MRRNLLLLAVVLLQGLCLQAQKDTAFKNNLFYSADYDELFDELDSFIDSITRPRSFSLINIGYANRVFNYKAASGSSVSPNKSLTLLPSVGYFSENGLGVSVAASIVKDGKQWNPYQFLATASYDYLQNINFLTGLSYTRYFTRDSLRFYTTPLQNEFFAYFTYRNFYIKPTLSASYGWGSRTEVEKRKVLIEELTKKKKKKGNGGNQEVGEQQISTMESIRDFNLSLSLRHDFYWLDVFISDDFWSASGR